MLTESYRKGFDHMLENKGETNSFELIYLHIFFCKNFKVKKKLL